MIGKIRMENDIEAQYESSRELLNFAQDALEDAKAFLDPSRGLCREIQALAEAKAIKCEDSHVASPSWKDLVKLHLQAAQALWKLCNGLQELDISDVLPYHPLLTAAEIDLATIRRLDEILDPWMYERFTGREEDDLRELEERFLADPTRLKLFTTELLDLLTLFERILPKAEKVYIDSLQQVRNAIRPPRIKVISVEKNQVALQGVVHTLKVGKAAAFFKALEDAGQHCVSSTEMAAQYEQLCGCRTVDDIVKNLPEEFRAEIQTVRGRRGGYRLKSV